MAVIDKVLVIESELTTSDVVIECELDISSGGKLPTYRGSYVVTPKMQEQSLNTKDKSMNDNVTVLKIPTEEVGNEYGTTFAIAREELADG